MKIKIMILLIMSALFCFLWGCKNGGPGETEKKLPESLQNADLSQHLEISIGFWNIQAMENSKEKDGVWRYLEELFNITIKPVNLNWSDYNERYLVMGVSDSLPDIFAATTITGTSENNALSLSDMISRKMLSPLPEDLSKYPEVKKTVDFLQHSLEQKDGKIYTFPRNSFGDMDLSSSDAGLLVRKDWMESLGITEPENLDAFIDMTVAFAAEDPDGNHIDDTIGYNVGNRTALGKWLILGIAPECNVYTWVKKDGQFLPSYLLPEFEDVVKAYRKLYVSGGLDPEFYLKKTVDSVYDFARGKLGALEYKTSPAALSEIKAYWNHYHDESEPFEDAVSILNIFPCSDGKRYSNSSSPFWSESLFSSHVDEEKMERILYLYEYLLSEEGWYLTRFGIEGEDYDFKDGKYSCLPDASSENVSELLLKKYPSLNLFTSLASWGGSNDDFVSSEQNNKRYGPKIMEMSNGALYWNQENTTMVERPYDFLQMSKEESDIFSTSTMIDEFTKVIIGNEDPVKMWKEVINRWKEDGILTYIDNLNKQAEMLNIK